MVRRCMEGNRRFGMAQVGVRLLVGEGCLGEGRGGDDVCVHTPVCCLKGVGGGVPPPEGWWWCTGMKRACVQGGGEWGRRRGVWHCVRSVLAEGLGGVKRRKAVMIDPCGSCVCHHSLALNLLPKCGFVGLQP